MSDLPVFMIVNSRGIAKGMDIKLTLAGITLRLLRLAWIIEERGLANRF